MKKLLFFLILIGCLSPANRVTAQSAGLGPSFKGPLAVQLWSFRKAFKQDVPGTLKRVRALGFTNVELAGFYGLSATQFKRELDEAGLKAVSMHVDLTTIQNKLDETIRDAKILGVQEIGVPWIKSPFTRKDCDLAISVFNQAGKKITAQGMTFFYHLHGYEFVPDESGTETLFERLMKNTDPAFVKIQLDTFHVAYPGQDPVKILQQYPGRVISLHLKDLRKEAAGNNSGEAKDEDGRPLGQGRIDWRGVLSEASKQGVKWYILEDETPTVWQNVPLSLKYLETLQYE